MHDDTYAGNVQTLPQRPSVNGHADGAVPDARGKRVANRSPWLDLPDPYDNLKVRVWLDYPQDIAESLTAPKDETPEEATARMMRFFKDVILQHDGWEMDDDLGPLPQPDTDEFWERIPTPLGRAIGLRFFKEIEKGNAAASRRSKPKNWKRR